MYQTRIICPDPNSNLPYNQIDYLLSDGQDGVWIGAYIFGGLSHLKFDGTWDFFTEENSHLMSNIINYLLSDYRGGIWIGTSSSGLAHLILLGTPQQILEKESANIIINWFLNSSPFDFHKVKYIELQRSLSKMGSYETVNDASIRQKRWALGWN